MYSQDYMMAYITVTPSKSGYTFTPPNRTVTINGASMTGRDFTASALFEYSISGAVTGDIQADITMIISGDISSNTLTSSSGNYSFKGLRNGIYTITPSKSGYTFSPSSRTVTIDGTSVQGQNFVSFVVNTYSISGVITGDVQAGVTITLSGSGSGTTTTDSSGNYSFAGLSNGTYTVTPSKIGYAFTPSSRTITIDNANVAGADFIAIIADSCSTWAGVITKYNDYVSGQAVWNDVITCYNQYTSSPP